MIKLPLDPFALVLEQMGLNAICSGLVQMNTTHQFGCDIWIMGWVVGGEQTHQFDCDENWQRTDRQTKRHIEVGALPK